MILFALGIIVGSVVMLVIIAFVTTYQISRESRDVIPSHKAPKYP